MATQNASKRARKTRTPRLKETAPTGKMSSWIGYEFRDPALLEQALTHGSFFYEQNNLREPTAPTARNDNERLEFLGDAVLGLVAAETLFAMFPDASEGLLTQMRSQLVSRKHLGDVAARLKLGAALRLGRGEERSGGRGKAVLGANALEAVAGAMFLDGGLEPVRKLFLGHIAAAELKTLAVAIEGGGRLSDAKSALQEYLQANEGVRAEYALVAEAGPDHDKKFTMQVRVVSGDGVRMAKATRRTKKLAEQEAARKLLARLTGLAGKTALR
jgi:ribonuclease-3